jgi:hypothetical protein
MRSHFAAGSGGFGAQSLGAVPAAPAPAPGEAVDAGRLSAAVRQVELLAQGARSGLAGDGYPAATRARLSAAEVARAEAGAAALRDVADRKTMLPRQVISAERSGGLPSSSHELPSARAGGTSAPTHQTA